MEKINFTLTDFENSLSKLGVEVTSNDEKDLKDKVDIAYLLENVSDLPTKISNLSIEDRYVILTAIVDFSKDESLLNNKLFFQLFKEELKYISSHS